MKNPVTQEDNMGCGAACMAFLIDCSYAKAIAIIGNAKKMASARGFYCRDLVIGLRRAGKNYAYKYVKSSNRKNIYSDGTIVFIKKSKRYPEGHYLCRHKGSLMDPWINFKEERNVRLAKSGFRKRLPGHPIYAIWKS